GRAAEPAVAPDRGGITVFQGSASHQPPRQVNGVVRPPEATRRRPMSGEDSDSWSDRDVFTGPAVERAVRIAATVPVGSLVRIAFSGYDTGDLIDLEGPSFIAKLPEVVPPNPRIYWGEQWFIQGHATGPVEYSPHWRDFYVEKTRCWLLDVAILKNW